MPIFTKDDVDLIEVIKSSIAFYALNKPFLLHEYCVMPNHIHVLYTETEYNLGFKNSFLSFTAKEIIKCNNQRVEIDRHDFLVNKADRLHQVWRRHSKNILVKSKDQYFAIASYIHTNPESEFWREYIYKEPKDSRLKLTRRFWS